MAALEAELAWAWRSRARGEARVGCTFSSLARAFQPGEVPDFVREGLLAAAEEEAQHAQRCLELAAHYGDARADVADADPQAPMGTPAERALVLIAACCISETISSAYLEHCLRASEDPRTRATLKALLRDEVGHAQLGWGYAAILPARGAVRATVEASLAGLIARTEQIWRGRIAELHRVADPARGYPPVEQCREVVGAAVRTLVMAGFAQVGLRVVATS